MTDVDYAETKEVATVLAQLNAEGYDLVQIEALNEDALAILAKLR